MELEPGRSAASAGSASAIPSNPSLNPSLPSMLRTTSQETKRSGLLDGKSCRRVQRLLGNIIVHLDLNAIDPGLETGSRKRFFQGHLVANISHLVRGFHGMNHGLVGGCVDDIVLDCRRGLVGLVIGSKIVDLHPEIDFLVALENNRLAVCRCHPRPY